MANVVITGVTSFLGAAVARAYREDGHCVYGIVRKSSKTGKIFPPIFLSLIVIWMKWRHF